MTHSIRNSLLLAAIAAMTTSCQVAKTQNPTHSQSVFHQHDAEVAALLSKMTLDEKIGQMIQVDQGSLKSPNDIETYYMGSLLSGGGSGPKNKADYNFTGWRSMIEGYQQHALHTRLAIPLLYGIDALHGNNNIPNATLFPHNIGLGCTRDPALIEKIAHITAEEVRATDINWTFAPCVTTPQDIRWGRTYEGFSSQPDITAPLGAAEIRGLQGNNLNDPLSIVATAKHFLADGGTTWRTEGRGSPLDQGNAIIDEATLRSIHLPAYKAAVNAGVATIMPSYSSWNGVKCSGNKYLLTDVLKKELGFEGFLISDYNAIDQISPDFPTCVKTSINAGMDMVMMTGGYAKFYTTLHTLVADGSVPMTRIDDAVSRILRVKFAAGLMSPHWSPTADRSLEKNFGSPEHRAVARQAVRESLVLLKNDRNTLPLQKQLSHIIVTGDGADDTALQCGGWTIDWQGKAGRAVPGATSLLSAIKSAVPKTCEVTYSSDTFAITRADAAIVVIAEQPYAEGRGDSKGPVISDQDRQRLAMLRSAGIPTIVVLYSGRPLVLGNVLNSADALVAAWLPGSEAEGITDILFGDAAPVGKLSFAWPASLENVPPGTDAKPLFPIDYGLNYADR